MRGAPPGAGARRARPRRRRPEPPTPAAGAGQPGRRGEGQAGQHRDQPRRSPGGGKVSDGHAHGHGRQARSRARCASDGSSLGAGQAAEVRHDVHGDGHRDRARRASRRPGTSTFTTMAKPGSVIGTGLYLFDDNTYGVAMPVVVEFNPGIPKKDRAAVQKRMFVRTDPPQPGAWHWVSNGTQAYYRAPEYWKPGTTLTVRIALAGMPLSNGRYGDVDRTATAKIGRRLRDEGRQRHQEDDRLRGRQGGPHHAGEPGQAEHPVVQRHHGGDGEEGGDDLRHPRRPGPGEPATSPRSSSPSGSPGVASTSTPRPGRRARRGTRTSRTAVSTCRRRTPHGCSSRP